MCKVKGVIYQGATLDKILARIDHAPWAAKYQNLPAGVAERAILATGRTVYELFQEALDAPGLSTENEAMLRCLERLSDEQRDNVLAMIRSVGDPWWLPHLRDSAVTRFTQLVNHMCFWLPRQEASARCPHLMAMLPVRTVCSIQTDLVPYLSSEMDCSIQWLMDLDDCIPFYSRIPGVDELFMEYTLLPRDLRIIPYTYALNLM